MRYSTVLLFIITFHSALCQYSLSGKILNVKTKAPVEYAFIEIADRDQWAVADNKGEFLLKNVGKGEISLLVSALGYVQKSVTLKVEQNRTDLTIYLTEDNLQLNEVVITAKRKTDEMATTWLIDRAGIEHLQVIGISDFMSLLPGGQTNRNQHLATGSAQLLAVRGTTSEHGNPTFGTAIEVDGIRLSNNASFGTSTSSIGEVYGVDTRNIATGAIESVEIITGIPSVEYGDLSNGMVKINSRRGKSPLHVELSTKPNTKQASAGKGFVLGNRGGTLNMSLEYTRSISNLASPYTAYDRKGISLLYENTFGRNNPLIFTAGLAGNLGGYNSKADPDAVRNTYLKERDNTLRGNLGLNLLLNKPWITGLEFSASANYRDNLTEENANKSSTSSTAAIHGMEEGYFVAQKYDEQPDAPIVLIPLGYWEELSFNDSRQLDFSAKGKAKWARVFGKFGSNLLLGADFNTAGNLGRGTYYADMSKAPTWREYRYDEIPFMNNLAVYLEEKASYRLGEASSLQLRAGLRSDFTFVSGSEYGTVGSLSPRVNLKYGNQRFSVHAGWGRAVKLPSFSALYPSPSYSDKLAFAPATTLDNVTFLAYYIRPYSSKYNPALRWQYNRQSEAGAEIRLLGAKISLTVYHNKIFDSYTTTTDYEPFAYNLTDPKMLDNCPIPSADRQYFIDRTYGIVTVVDKTGKYASQTLDYREMRTFKTTGMYINGSPSTQSGLDWIVDFGKINAIKTAVRFDGKYYRYRGTEEHISAYAPLSQIMADNNPYKYVGWYAGGSSAANGSETRTLNGNLTFTTHIPAIRLLFSLRVESTLYNYTQNLSEYQGAERGFAMDSRADYFPSASGGSIYNSDRYIGLYPLYYTTYEDPETKIPFAEKFLWARDNDRDLYNELAKLVVKTNTNYYFNANRISAYYSANINVTKEIGDYATLTFQARNFLNNLQTVHSSDDNSTTSLYGSGYIPGFYYGLSLKIKL